VNHLRFVNSIINKGFLATTSVDKAFLRFFSKMGLQIRDFCGKNTIKQKVNNIRLNTIFFPINIDK